MEGRRHALSLLFAHLGDVAGLVTNAIVPLLVLSACGSDDGTAAAATNWAERSVPVDESGIGRYEPEERIDFDNVVSFADGPSDLTLPEPPKSGFRLVVPPRTLEPGEEVGACFAWPFPVIRREYVYAAKMYTSGAVHHSNVTGVPLTSEGPSPYPSCHAGQEDEASQTANVFRGEIPDVLFTNSTQVEDSESLVFPAGMAYGVSVENREIVTVVHWLNATDHALRSEVVYDFYTMPGDLVDRPLAAFAYDNRGISVAPHTTEDVVATCDIKSPGHIVSLMPHAHERTTAFTVDLLTASGEASRIYDGGAFDPESDLRIFEEPIDMAGFESLRYSCTVENDLDIPIQWGVGTNEMCMIFGFLYPPSAQQIGLVPEGRTACTAFDIGVFRR